MEIRDGVRLAFAQIRAQKLKSFFSVVGVVIGVMFLMTVVSVLEGLNRYMEEDFARTIFGLNTITIRRNPSVQINVSEAERREWRRRPRLTFADADAIRRQIEIPVLVAVETNSQITVRAENGREVENVQITGASHEFFRIRDFDVQTGRLFTAPEDRAGAAVIVLGHETAENLFGRLDPLGRTVRVSGFPFRVIGVLEKQGSLFGMSLDNRAIAPATSPINTLFPSRRTVGNILVRAPDETAMARAGLELEAIMRIRHRLRPGEANTFSIETEEDSLAFWARISRILYIAFPGLVGISLVVGGMVIMNIMLVSVMERTREIGIRKAVGARSRDIVVQVLIESATLSCAGAALGILIGIALAYTIRTASPLPAAIAPKWMLVSVVLGAGVGIVAGLYPATRAARLDPVVALRAE